MALTDEDLQKIAALMTPVEQRVEALEDQLGTVQAQMNEGFNKMFDMFDGLYKQSEDREHEYLAVREQIQRLEERVDTLEKKVA